MSPPPRSEGSALLWTVRYSLRESAKLCRVQHKVYLRAAAKAAVGGEGPLLPHEFKKGPP